MGAFQRTDWLEESSADEGEVRLALHYTALAHLFSELKSNKAVFKPQMAGESLGLAPTDMVKWLGIRN